MQLTKTAEPVTETESLADLASKVKQETVTHRTVKLKYKSCCGCGCSYYVVNRVVAADSKMQDGDTIRSLEDDDNIARNEYGSYLEW